MKNKKVIITIIVVSLIVAILWYFVLRNFFGILVGIAWGFTIGYSVKVDIEKSLIKEQHRNLNDRKIMRKVNFKLLISVLLSLFLLLCTFYIYPLVNDYVAQNRVYEDFDTRIKDNVMNSFVRVLVIENWYGGLAESAEVGAVVFKKEGNKYYALTAYHCVDTDVHKISVLKRSDLSNIEYEHKTGEVVDTDEYYDRFPSAQIEYYDKSIDIAIISFVDDSDYWNVSYISNEVVDRVDRNDRVVIVGSPYPDDGNAIYDKAIKMYGKILTTSASVRNEDGQIHKNFFVLSAYTKGGSSGSPVFNEKMELIGIVQGGRFWFGKFINTCAIPNNIINNFLDRWNNREM